MSIVSCPRCGDKVSLPPSAEPSAVVQCPLCLEEYYLSDALIQLPPMLLVVGSRAEAATQAAEREGEYRLAEPVAAAVSEAQFEPAAGTVAARPQLKTVSRRRPQERSAIGEIIKVVLGGVAGLAGGLLVLWWGFGVDVGDLGPQVSKVQYLRFLVPPKLRAQAEPPGTEPSQLDTMNTDDQQGKGTGDEPGTNGGLGQGALEGASAEDDQSQPASSETTKQRKAAKANGKRKGNKPPEFDPFADDVLKSSKPAASDSPELKIDDPLSAIKPKQEDDKPKTKAEPPATKPEGGGGGGFFGEGRPPTQAALAQRLAQATEAVHGSIDALENVNRDDSEAVDAALKYVYDMASRLTTAVLEMDRSAAEFEEQRPALDDALRRLARDGRRTNVIRQRARIKLDDEASSGSWILIAGAVKDIRSAGDWFETMVEATDDGRFVAVLTADDPHGAWKGGQPVLVLGRVVRDPAANTKGYEGDAEIAVTSSHGVTTAGPPAPADDAKTENKAKKTESSTDKEDKPAAETPKPEEPKSDEPKSDEDKPAQKDPE
jgi:hypothetical protein